MAVLAGSWLLPAKGNEPIAATAAGPSSRRKRPLPGSDRDMKITPIPVVGPGHKGMQSEVHELLRLFRLGAETFPTMMHVLVGWPKGDRIKGVPLDQNLLPSDLRFDEESLVKLWNDQGYEQSGVRVIEPRRHWLMRASGRDWNRIAAFDTFRPLAEKAFGHLYRLCSYDRPLPNEVLGQIWKELHEASDTAQWLYALYHFRVPDVMLRGEPPIEMYVADWHVRCLGDIFQESAFACSEIIAEMRTQRRLSEIFSGPSQESSAQAGKQAEAEPAEEGIITIDAAHRRSTAGGCLHQATVAR